MRPGRTTYDAVVVGGRVAGATVAALVGDRGLRVLPVERVRFPSTTISTHFFRGAGLVAVLDRLGVLERRWRWGRRPSGASGTRVSREEIFVVGVELSLATDEEALEAIVRLPVGGQA